MHCTSGQKATCTAKVAQKYLKVMKSPIPPHFFCRYIFWQWVNCLSMHQNVNELKLGNLDMLIKLRGKDDHRKENLLHQKETLTLLSHTVMKTLSLLMRQKHIHFNSKWAPMPVLNLLVQLVLAPHHLHHHHHHP